MVYERKDYLILNGEDADITGTSTLSWDIQQSYFKQWRNNEKITFALTFVSFVAELEEDAPGSGIAIISNLRPFNVSTTNRKDIIIGMIDSTPDYVNDTNIMSNSQVLANPMMLEAALPGSISLTLNNGIGNLDISNNQNKFRAVFEITYHD